MDYQNSFSFGKYNENIVFVSFQNKYKISPIGIDHSSENISISSLKITYRFPKNLNNVTVLINADNSFGIFFSRDRKEVITTFVVFFFFLRRCFLYVLHSLAPYWFLTHRNTITTVTETHLIRCQSGCRFIWVGYRTMLTVLFLW